MGENSRESHFMKGSKKTAIWWIDENMRSPFRHVLKIPHPLVLLLQYKIKNRFAVPKVLVRQQSGEK